MVVRALKKVLRPFRFVRALYGPPLRYYKKYGLRRLTIKTISRLAGSAAAPRLRWFYDRVSYGKWIAQNERVKRAPLAASPLPLISIVVPCYETPLVFLRELVRSVQAQSYPQWELCLSLAGTLPSESAEYLSRIASKDRRVTLVPLTENKGISANTNAAIAASKGSYIGFCDHDDTLAPFALEEVVRVIQNAPTTDFIYSDEDKLSPKGKRRTPHFKPDWSPDLLRSYNYITHFVVVSQQLLDKVGQLQSEFDGAQDYDFVLRATEQATKIAHIPQVLYHWREHQNSTSLNTDAKPAAATAAVQAVQAHLARIKRTGTCTPGPFFGAVTTTYALTSTPLISIIIPSHDQADFLNQCVQSILQKTTYPNYEIIIMENHSKNPETFALYERIAAKNIRVVTWQKPFNYSEINNDGVAEARGEILLFLNNDVAVISADWLEQMVMHLQFEENAAIGAKLYYQDKTVQHAGVILGVGGIAGHSHKNFPAQDTGYFGRLGVVQNLSAVTGACLMVRRSSFMAVGGFDTGLPIAFNDIDFCLKLRQRGELVLWTPFAELFHYESKTRGYEDTFEKQQRFLKEIDYFKKKWSDTLNDGDPYYSPNLTLAAEDFSINA